MGKFGNIEVSPRCLDLVLLLIENKLLSTDSQCIVLSISKNHFVHGISVGEIILVSTETANRMNPSLYLGVLNGFTVLKCEHHNWNKMIKLIVVDIDLKDLNLSTSYTTHPVIKAVYKSLPN